MPRMTETEKADRITDYYMEQGTEHGPVYYTFYGELIMSIGFDKAQESFIDRYPLMADLYVVDRRLFD